MTSWYCSPAARRWTAPPGSGAARAFHETLPGFAPTPLVSSPDRRADLDLPLDAVVVLLSTEAANTPPGRAEDALMGR